MTNEQTPKSAAGEPVREPTPPFAEQHQASPGLERDLDPAPRWRAERYKAAGKLTGLSAIVTGGDSGIGRAVAYLFAREGADVLITALPGERPDAEETSRAITEIGRRCVIVEGDLSTPTFCDDVINHAIEAFGTIHVLVHNAAWQNRKPIDKLPDEELDYTVRTNLYAYLRLVRAAVPHMPEGGSITTGSIVGFVGSNQLSDYGATKGAINSVTKCLAKELADRRIRVNCVAPGPVWTPLNPSDAGLSEEQVAHFGAGKNPLDRPAQPEECAPAYVYFASNADSSYVTGAVLPVTGMPI